MICLPCVRGCLVQRRRCGGPGVDIDRFGAGVCDDPCPGDDSFICGGYLAYTAYEVGERLLAVCCYIFSPILLRRISAFHSLRRLASPRPLAGRGCSSKHHEQQHILAASPYPNHLGPPPRLFVVTVARFMSRIDHLKRMTPPPTLASTTEPKQKTETTSFSFPTTPALVSVVPCRRAGRR